MVNLTQFSFLSRHSHPHHWLIYVIYFVWWSCVHPDLDQILIEVMQQHPDCPDINEYYLFIISACFDLICSWFQHVDITCDWLLIVFYVCWHPVQSWLILIYHVHFVNFLYFQFQAFNIVSIIYVNGRKLMIWPTVLLLSVTCDISLISSLQSVFQCTW